MKKARNNNKQKPHRLTHLNGSQTLWRLSLLASTTKCSYPDSTSLDFFFTSISTRLATKIQQLQKEQRQKDQTKKAKSINKKASHTANIYIMFGLKSDIFQFLQFKFFVRSENCVIKKSPSRYQTQLQVHKKSKIA